MSRYPVTVANGVAEIALSRLDELSRHDIDAAIELRDTIFDTSDDDEVKAILLTGELPFCARLAALPAMSSAEAFTRGYEAYLGGAGVYQQLAYCKKVTIAAVDGECADAGMLIALYADLTLASERAVFWPPFVSLPEANFAYATLVMRLGRAKAWALRGNGLTAAAAQAAGLVNEVVPAARLRQRAQELAAVVTRRPLDGITVSKLAFQAYLDSRGVDKDFEVGALHAQARAASGGASR
jgi:enoyl-CoA hydratase/carnithine racemase